MRRLVSLLIVAIWMAPSAAALTVGLHLALDHHGEQVARHAHDVTELARAAVHGHHHQAEATPDHEHEAIADTLALIPRPSPGAVLSSPMAPRAPLADRPCQLRWTWGSPVPLFTANCCLLL